MNQEPHPSNAQKIFSCLQRKCHIERNLFYRVNIAVPVRVLRIMNCCVQEIFDNALVGIDRCYKIDPMDATVDSFHQLDLKQQRVLLRRSVDASDCEVVAS